MSRDPSYCYKAYRPAITSATIDKNSSTITLVFNTTVMFKDAWQLSDWRFEMFGPKRVYDFTYNFRNSMNITMNATNTIYIDISYGEQYFGYDIEFLVLKFANRMTTIESGNSTEMIDTQFTFTLHGKEVSNNSLIELMGLIVVILFILFSIIMLTTSVMGY